MFACPENPHPVTPTLRNLVLASLRIAAGAVMLLAVVAANGRPAVFADSNIYYWMGQMQVRPVRYALAPLIGGPTSAAKDPEAADESPDEMQMRRTEMAARSPWFGLLLFCVESLGGLWLFAGVQAVAASFAIHALWRSAAPSSGVWTWLGLMGGLSATSTLPFFAGFAMPDLWAGAGLCALAALALYPDRLQAATRSVLFVLVFAAMAFHKTNGVIAAGALCTLAVATLMLRRPLQRLAPAVLMLLGAISLSVLLNAAYVGAIRSATGETLRSPPFLAARILADGPGRTYLKAACARGERWALCRYAHLPLTDSQDILWSGNPKKGVFGLATATQRIQIDQEQTRFVLSVVRAYPLQTAGASLRNVVTELGLVYLDDPVRDPHFYLTDPDWRDTFIADMVHRMSDCGDKETGCKPRFDSAQSQIWHSAFFALGVLFVAWRLTRRDVRTALAQRDDETWRLVLLTGFIISATLLNAAVTGALSGVFARYQARISWLIPMLALILSMAPGARQAKQFGREGADV